MRGMPSKTISEIFEFCERELKAQSFDFLSVGIIDFNKATFEGIELGPNPDDLPLFYDLASLTKPLILGAYASIDPSFFDKKERQLLLNHKSGIPAWGRLDREGWKDQILNYKIKESNTLYSDFGALRLMLEIEKAKKENLKSIVSPHWDKELFFWKDLPPSIFCPITGFRGGKIISSIVHDDNAFIINDFCSHAGLFGTLSGVIQSILNLEKNYSLLAQMEQAFEKKEGRFINGWDTVENRESTLAGVGCSDKTFGHLGFTGTSIWIDALKKRGVVILSNATKSFWYDREGLNQIRKKVGSLVWNLDN